MAPKASIGNFFRAFHGHWLEAMSGGFSVPFAAVAVFFDGLAQAIFFLLAIGAGGFAAYRVWSFEREKVVDLEEKLRPKLKFVSLRQTPKATSLRDFEREWEMEIENDSGTELPNCLAKVTRINALDGTEPVTTHLPMALRTRRNTDGNGGGPFTMRAWERKFIPICARNDGERAEIKIFYEDVMLPQSFALHETKDFELTICIYGAPTATSVVLRATVVGGQLTLLQERPDAKEAA